MRPAHRQIRPGFIDKHEPGAVYLRRPPAIGAPLGLDIRPILFCGPRTFFLKTYPVRRSARSRLDRWTRWSRATRRLYARVSSSVVRSGFSRTTTCIISRSTGECQPPPRSSGATDPVSRDRATQRSTLRWPIEKCLATVAYDPSPDSYATTTRSRRSIAYGLGIGPSDHIMIVNSSDFWG